MIPAKIKPFLWSYDTNKIDFEKNKNRIIANILNLGTKEALIWLFKKYSKKEIKNTLKSSYVFDLSPKSLNYWSLIFNIDKKKLKSRIK